MKIEFTDEQLELLKSVLDEYAEICYHEMFEYKHMAVDAEEGVIRDQYNGLADEEEASFNEVKKLSDYIKKYEELMRNA